MSFTKRASIILYLLCLALVITVLSLGSAGAAGDDDLLGIPLRLTLSPRTLQSQSVEAKWRTDKEAQLLPGEEAFKRNRKLSILLNRLQLTAVV